MPFDDKTSYKTQFPKHDVEPRKDYTLKEVYISQGDPLEALTDGRRKDFTLKNQAKIENFKPEEVVNRSEMPFEDTTSYKTQFPKHDVEPRKDYTPQKKCMCHQMSPSRVKHTITVISGGCICQRERTSNPKKLSIDQKGRLMVQHLTKHSFLNMMLNHAKTTPLKKCISHQMILWRVSLITGEHSLGNISQWERFSSQKKWSSSRKNLLMTQHHTKLSFQNLMLNHAKITPRKKCIFHQISLWRVSLTTGEHSREDIYLSESLKPKPIAYQSQMKFDGSRAYNIKRPLRKTLPWTEPTSSEFFRNYSYQEEAEACIKKLRPNKKCISLGLEVQPF